MTPVQCRVPHRPEEGKYGDCIRACVASLLELDAEAVPHFAEDNPSGELMMDRMRLWLKGRGLAPFITGYGDCSISQLLEDMEDRHPDVHYMLFGGTGEGDHVVIAKGGAIVHNPAWVGCRLIGPGSTGYFQVIVFVAI